MEDTYEHYQFYSGDIAARGVHLIGIRSPNDVMFVPTDLLVVFHLDVW